MNRFHIYYGTLFIGTEFAHDEDEACQKAACDFDWWELRAVLANP